jgi:hypothetical protein
MNITHYFFNNEVGIVRVEDKYDGIKYYSGMSVMLTPESDARRIADWGNTFPKVAGEALFLNGFMTTYNA